MTTIRNYNAHATAELTHNGMTKTLKEWSDILDIPYATMRMRYTRGIRGDDLFYKNAPRVRSNYDRLSVLDNDTKLELIKQAEELGIDPMELLHKILNSGLQKLASSS